MKNGIDKLEILHIDTWDISNSFKQCNSFTSIDDWDISNVTDFSKVFTSCTSLDEDYILKERRRKLEKIRKNNGQY